MSSDMDFRTTGLKYTRLSSLHNTKLLELWTLFDWRIKKNTWSQILLCGDYNKEIEKTLNIVLAKNFNWNAGYENEWQRAGREAMKAGG